MLNLQCQSNVRLGLLGDEPSVRIAGLEGQFEGSGLFRPPVPAKALGAVGGGGT